MKIKFTFTAVLLLMAILLGSCGNTHAKDPEDPFASLRLSKEQWITYGIEKVQNGYQSQDIAATFGKSYEELKSDWLVYLYK